MEVFELVMKAIIKEKEGDKSIETDRLKENIEKTQLLIQRMDEKYFQDKITEAERNTYLSRYNTQVRDDKARIEELNSFDDNYAMYLKSTLPFLSNLDHHYEIASVSFKQKPIGSIFPGKLVFDKVKYRTTEESRVLTLICSAGKGFNGSKIEKASISADLSIKAPPVRLELTTP